MSNSEVGTRLARDAPPARRGGRLENGEGRAYEEIKGHTQTHRHTYSLQRERDAVTETDRGRDRQTQTDTDTDRHRDRETENQNPFENLFLSIKKMYSSKHV